MQTLIRTSKPKMMKAYGPIGFQILDCLQDVQDVQDIWKIPFTYGKFHMFLADHF